MWQETASPMELRASILKAFDSIGIQRHVVLKDERGSEPWAVDYRSVPNGDGYLVSMANYWGTPKQVRIVLKGRRPSKTKDLREDKMVDGGFIKLKPLQALLFQVE